MPVKEWLQQLMENQNQGEPTVAKTTKFSNFKTQHETANVFCPTRTIRFGPQGPISTIFGWEAHPQWFGPFRVLESSSGQVKILASPKLGGMVKVSVSHVRVFPMDTSEEEEDAEWEALEEEEEMVEEVEEATPNTVENRAEFSVEEMASQSIYLVKRILKHKRSQGWKFLVLWAPPWKLEDATWEPPKISYLARIGSILFLLNIVKSTLSRNR
jgi:hypothetical protein